MTLLWIGFVLAIAVQTVVFVTARNALKEAAKAKEEEKIARTKSTEAEEGARLQLARIEAKVGDPDAAARYIDAYKKLTNQAVSEKTNDAVKLYFAEKQKRAEVRDATKTGDERLLTIQKLRVEPLYQSVITKFEIWVQGVQKESQPLQITKGAQPAVLIAQAGGRGYYVRSVKFPSGSQVHLGMTPMIIDSGDVLQSFTLTIAVEKNHTTSQIWVLEVAKPNYSLFNPRPQELGYKNITGDTEDPTTDKPFQTAVSSSFDQAMVSVFDENYN